MRLLNVGSIECFGYMLLRLKSVKRGWLKLKYLKKITWKLWVTLVLIFLLALLWSQSNEGLSIYELIALIVSFIYSIIHYVWLVKK